MQTYVDNNGELISDVWSEQKRTLIIRDGVVDDYPYFGKISVFDDMNEYKYLITKKDKFQMNAIRHFYIDDEEIKSREGSLRKFMKERKGKLYHISFLRLKKFNEDTSWYKLIINRSQNLYYLDHQSFANMVYSEDELYKCKE